MNERIVLLGAGSAVFTRGLDGYVDSFDLATNLADDLLSAQAMHLPQFQRS